MPSPRLRLNRYFDRGDEIFVGQNALVEIDLEAELLVDLVAADAAEIVILRIEEQPLEQRPGVRHGRRIARAEPAIDILERFFFVVRRIFLQRLDDGVVVRDVDHLHVFDARASDLADDRLGERLESARDTMPFAVEHVRDQHLASRVLLRRASR